ncbi:MAG: hypothetical protein EA362_01275 [Saprospirales bacterium]|nr:MAG: hypothetical protein EA362_01275 [Saprospirales bacterium]
MKMINFFFSLKKYLSALGVEEYNYGRKSLAVFMPFVLVSLLFQLSHSGLLNAQEYIQPQTEADTTLPRSPIKWIDSRDVRISTEDGIRTHFLKGNVELRQDSLYFFADSSVLRKDLLFAAGNVILVQGDSLEVFSDTMNYNGVTRYGFLTGECFVRQNQSVLYSNFLEYDAARRIAYYNRGAVLTDGDYQLTSLSGRFHLDTENVFFRDSVEVIGDDFFLKSDSLRYSTKTGRSHFIAPTLIRQGEASIYTEGGYYDLETGNALLYDNPQYKSNDQLATADTMIFDGINNLLTLIGNVFYQKDTTVIRSQRLVYDLDKEKAVITEKVFIQDGDRTIQSDTVFYNLQTGQFTTKGRTLLAGDTYEVEADSVFYGEEEGIGFLHGNVLWTDTESGVQLRSNEAYFIDSTGLIKSYGGRPLMSYPSETDTLYMAADTILSFLQTAEADTQRITLAYYNVVIYRNDMQAICDSLSHSEVDGMFRMMYDPMIWMDTTQLAGDTIDIAMDDGEMRSAFIRRNAMVLTSPDSVYFNQIKGREIRAHFRDGSLSSVRTFGNAEALYFVLDENDAYIGVNKSESSEIRLNFEENEVISIAFFGQPNSILTPMQKAKADQFKLEGFNWDTSRRPRSLEDLKSDMTKRLFFEKELVEVVEQ